MFKPAYPALCQPLRLRGLTLDHRMAAAPMGYPELTAEGLLTQDAIAFYELRAKGGAAVVTVGEAVVHYATGRSHGRSINLSHPDVLAGLTQLSRAIRRHGAAASIELAHGGKFSAVDSLPGERKRDAVKYGPVDETLPDGSIVKEMPPEMIREIVEAYGKAAALVKRAGFDMLLVHGGHGWLLEQFYSPATNTRTDAYGGSRENRARLLLEVLDAIRAAVGPDFPIELRISAGESFPGGYDLNEAIELAKLVESKIDLLHVSAGSNEDSFYETHPSMYMERGCNVHFAAEIKKHISIPVSTIGALNEPEMLEEIIASGQADVVYMGRALLADPELPRKVIQGRTNEILRCMRCFMCLAERMQTQTRVCALNPVIGKEYEALLAPPAKAKKRVLVAGGGVGGMEAAVTAALRGHDVTLCEASGELGGALKAEKFVSFKQDAYRIIQTLTVRMAKAGVHIHLNTPVTPELVEALAPDHLIVAVGGAAIVPFTGENVYLAGALQGRVPGKRIAVLGGGLVGCETAVQLAMSGAEVTVVELLDEVAKDANARQRPALMAELTARCTVRTGLRGLRAEPDGLVCADGTGAEVKIPADAVVLAVGQRPLRETVDALRFTAPEVRILGDCRKAGTIREAIFNGYHAGMDV